MLRVPGGMMPLAAVHIRKKSKGSGTTGLLADPTPGHGVEHPGLGTA